jgi:RNA-directed DNA polymerase
MTANRMIAGAVSDDLMDWHASDWHKAHQIVRRLQARIVKATQMGRWGKVRALQHLLTHSWSGKLLAVKRVTENQGKKTPGVDGEIWDTPTKKATAVSHLRQRGYQPQPLRRVYIRKSNGKKRPLGIATMIDRAMQALYLLAVDPVAETTADPNSYGFRKERSTADAIQQCFNVLHSDYAAQWIFEGDLLSCFDRISHNWMLANLPIEKAILQKWLKAGFMEDSILYPIESGTPQGAVCSPVLANLTLDGLEQAIREKYPKATKLSRQAKVNLIRYCDDFIITGSSKELLENEVRPLVEQFMKERGLELSPEKTQISHIQDGFDFLGQNVRKYRGRLLIKPSKKSIKACLEKVREIINRNKQATAGQLIVQLNPVLRGWANYHRHVASKETFAHMDHALFQALWHWAKRRHPGKSLWWIKDKYFHSIQERNWVFCGEIAGQGEHRQRVQLISVASVPIQRHTKIQGAANPYDPDWELYFEARLSVKMAQTLKGKRALLHLWKEQHGICPVCRQRITTDTGWHNHHIRWKTDGGMQTAENRVLLHPTCHQQVHHQRLEVVKPRPHSGV